MSYANGKYHLVTGSFNISELKLIEKCGLVGTIEHCLGNSRFRTTMEFSLAEAQKHRDTLIKMGADPTKIRVEY